MVCKSLEDDDPILDFDPPINVEAIELLARTDDDVRLAKLFNKMDRDEDAVTRHPKLQLLNSIVDELMKTPKKYPMPGDEVCTILLKG